MSWLRRVRSFWRSVVRRSDMEQQMSDELQFHLAQRADHLARRDGLSLEEAMRRARLEFGSLEKYKEEARHSVGLGLVDELRSDARYAWRTFARSKVFTATAVATLALGIGANTAIFSLLDAVLMRLPPVNRPEQLVEVLLQRPGQEPASGFTNAIWEAVRDQQDVFSGVFAWSVPQRFDLGRNGARQSVDGIVVSGRYFGTLGVPTAAGRLFSSADDYRGCPPIAVLSYGLWQTQFGGSPSAIGSTVALHGQPFQITGVISPRFHGVEVGRTFDVAVPLCASALFDKMNLDSSGRWWLQIVGRSKPGMTPDQLQARLDLLSPAVMKAASPLSGNEDPFLKRRLVATPAGVGRSPLQQTFAEPLMMLMAGVAIVLVIACANLASLMLARANTRAREIAIRTSLGAARWRLVRQLLTESMLLSAAGAALGLIAGRWAAAFIVQRLNTDQDHIFVDLSLDARVLAFTAGAAIVTGVLVGLLPALRSTSHAVFAAMKNNRTAGDGRLRVRAGKWIVAGQLALSLVLLVGGGLLLRTFTTLLTLDPGFDRTNVVVAAAKPPRFAADTVTVPPAQREIAYEEIERRLRSVPGVTAVARAFTSPIGRDNWYSRITPDVANPPSDEQSTTSFNFVTPGYFSTLKMGLLTGRDFDQRDTKESPFVAIVNETLVRQFFPGVNAIGRTFRRASVPQPVQIVGIVKDSKYESLRDAVPPTVFMPATQVPRAGEVSEFVIRTSVEMPALVAAIQRTVADVNIGMPLEFRTLSEQIAQTLVRERLLATLAGFFGVLALVLAMIGLYGVLNYLVTDRQTEFGIRMALGANSASILHLVMREVVIVVAAGIAAGLVAALASVTLLQRLLYGLEPRDVPTIAMAVALLSSMALVAGYLPARRATRVDPIVALRAE